MKTSAPAFSKEQESRSKPVGIGLIGTGTRLLGLVRKLPGLGSALEITALSDPSEDSLYDAAADIGIDATQYDDYREVVRDPAVQWVMIGSWNVHHREHVVAAFEAGKHVFCEKPLATTMEDLLAIRDAHARSGKMLVMGLTLRYSPHYRAIKEIIDEGEIGQVISFEFNETLDFNHGGFIHGDWRRKTEWAGTHLLEKCCHDLDIANWLMEDLPARVASFGGCDFFLPANKRHQERLGPDPETGRPAFQLWRDRPESDNPFTEDKDIVDNQVAIIEYSKGVRATFHTNCVAGIPERRIYVCGSEGAVRADVLTGSIELQRYGWDSQIERRDTIDGSEHGDGDEVLTEKLHDAMVSGVDPHVGVVPGLTSAVTAFAIDNAMERGEVVDLAPYWDEIGVPKRNKRGG